MDFRFLVARYAALCDAQGSSSTGALSEASFAYLVDPRKIQVRWKEGGRKGGHSKVYEGVYMTKEAMETSNRVAVKVLTVQDQENATVRLKKVSVPLFPLQAAYFMQ
jgi:hypothetical protein